MKYLIFVALSIMVLINGCCFSEIVKSTEEKSVHCKLTIYGFKMVFFDPAMYNYFPTVYFGFGEVEYRSLPVKKGQPMFVQEEIGSIWTTRNLIKQTVWIGRVKEDSDVEFEKIPAAMLGVNTKTATFVTNKDTMTITPDNPNSQPTVVNLNGDK